MRINPYEPFMERHCDGSRGVLVTKYVAGAVAIIGGLALLCFVGLPMLYAIFSAEAHSGSARVRNDKEFLAFAGNRRVGAVIATSNAVTDRGVAAIARMPSVRYISLDGTMITDKALPLLARSGSITNLDINDAAVTDRGIAALRGQLQLTYLNLSRTRITDKSLAVIGTLEHLERLFLNNTLVSDKGMRNLSSLKQLTTLSLQNTKITDAALASLEDLPLQWLSLRETAVTDAAIDALGRFRHLAGVDLRDTGVSEGKIADFDRTLRPRRAALDSKHRRWIEKHR